MTSLCYGCLQAERESAGSSNQRTPVAEIDVPFARVVCRGCLGGDVSGQKHSAEARLTGSFACSTSYSATAVSKPEYSCWRLLDVVPSLLEVAQCADLNE